MGIFFQNHDHCMCKMIFLCFLFSFVLCAVSSQENITTTQNLQNEENNHAKSTNNKTSEIKSRMVTVCTTPNGDVGFCMNLQNCTILQNYTKNASTKKFFEASKCGPKNENKHNPRVCCGKYSNFKNTEVEDPFPKVCGYQNVTVRGRIFGGTEAQLGEFPWLARLIHKDAGGSKTFGCSGFLISPTFIVTAAHCLKSENVQILGPIHEVQLGEHNINTKIDCNPKNTTCAPKPQIIRVKKNIVHSKYRPANRNHPYDIGLIHLKKAVKLSAYVSPICLFETVDFEPFEYWLSGWGSTEKSSISPVKMKVSVPPFLHSNCTTKYGQINIKINKEQLCAGGKKNKDSCRGDSGGPLMVVTKGNKWFAAGVVSFGLDCGKEGWPGIYSNVTSYRDWIVNTMLTRITNKMVSKMTGKNAGKKSGKNH